MTRKDVHRLLAGLTPQPNAEPEDEPDVVVGRCRCGAVWTGEDVCHCAVCHLTFTAIGGFDFHRIGPDHARRCRTPSELRAKGYAPNEAGYWRRPRPPESLPRTKRRAKRRRR